MASPLQRGLSSISNKVLVALVTVTVVPTVTVAIYALRTATRALGDRELSLVIEATSRDAREVQDTLDRVYRDLVEASNSRPLRTAVRDVLPALSGRAPMDLDAVDPWRGRMNAAQADLERMVREHPSARSLLVLATVSQISTPMMRINREDGTIETFQSLSVTRETGLPQLEPGPSLPEDRALQEAMRSEARDHPHRRVLRTTVRTGDGQVLEAFLVEINAQDGGDKVGTLILTLSWSRLLESVRPSSDEERTAVGLASRQLALQTTTAAGALAPIPDALRSGALRGQAGAMQTPSGFLVSLAPLQHPLSLSDEFSYLVAWRPTPDTAIDQFRLVFTAVLAGSLLLALGLGTYLSRRMTRPLRDLRDGAMRLGAGELEQHLRVSTNDEVAEVSQAFNSMAAELRSLYQGMEQTIEERTEQLQQALDELRGAHDQLIASEARYADIVENAAELIQVTDVNGRLLSVNRRYAELFARTPDELKGVDFFDCVATDHRDATRRAFEGVADGRPLNAYPSVLMAADERRVPVEISATAVVSDGVAAGVRAIMRDVSERKRIEAQLIQAERLSSVGVLAAGVAHEINNPLGIITMFAQRALEKARTGSMDVDKLEKIVTQAQRVAQITRGLLDFSRAGPTELQPFRLEEVVRETVDLLHERARQNDVALAVDVADDLPSVRGNPQQIGQVVMNLVLNALHAVPDGGSIRLSVQRSSSSDRDGVQVIVEDSGPGIPEDVLPKLFEPFFTTKEPGEGTGLGLSVSYGILREHHGHLAAENRAEGGARFVLTLPAVAT